MPGSRAHTRSAFSTPPAVGSGIIVPIAPYLPGVAPPTAVDNQGNTFQLASTHIDPGFNGARASILFLPRLAGVTAPYTVSVSHQGGNPWFLGNAIEVSGVGGGLACLLTARTNGTSTAATTGTSLASPVAELFVAAAYASARAASSIAVESVSPAWTQEYEELPWTNSTGEADSRLRTAQTGVTQACNWTVTNNAYAAVLAAFTATTAGAGGPTVVRVTQDAVETLSLPSFPASRVTQSIVEILATTANMAAEGRITQAVIETLQQSPPPNENRVTQALIEILQTSPPPVAARVTQIALDVFLPVMVASRNTQNAVEVMFPVQVTGRVTQGAVEVFRGKPPLARPTQLVGRGVPHPPALHHWRLPGRHRRRRGILPRRPPPVTLGAAAMPYTTTTLAGLQPRMIQRWDQVVFWTPEEARLALNEALREWNLLTGRWRTARAALGRSPPTPEITLPGVLTYAMRVTTAAGAPLIPSSLLELDLGRAAVAAAGRARDARSSGRPSR